MTDLMRGEGAMVRDFHPIKFVLYISVPCADYVSKKKKITAIKKQK